MRLYLHQEQQNIQKQVIHLEILLNIQKIKYIELKIQINKVAVVALQILV